MNVRTLSAIVAFAAFTPLAAFAGPPSGNFADVIGPQASIQSEPQLKRTENRNYVEGDFDQVFVRDTTVTVEQVRREIAAAPLPVIGA